MKTNRKTLATYVSKTRLKDIDHQMLSSYRIDQDYFIKAQDYLDDWVDHITVGQPKMKAHFAVVDVALGADAATIKHLGVTLVQEDGVWKIRDVR